MKQAGDIQRPVPARQSETVGAQIRHSRGGRGRHSGHNKRHSAHSHSTSGSCHPCVNTYVHRESWGTGCLGSSMLDVSWWLYLIGFAAYLSSVKTPISPFDVQHPDARRTILERRQQRRQTAKPPLPEEVLPLTCRQVDAMTCTVHEALASV